jgi:glycosyltransferase involved in cell wall biosynthesis
LTHDRVDRGGQPLVSVIIPVYNGQRFLGDAIRSALAQTYPATECIVVDDGSNDGSAAVARSFGPRVRVLSKENGGVASARNAGVLAASGELVAFLDADDYWLPDKLEVQMRAWLRRPWAGMCFTGYAMASGDRGRPRRRIMATEPDHRIRAATLLEGYGIAFGITALLTRSAIDVLGPFDERLSVSADISYAWRLLQSYEVLAIPQPLAVYRLHGRDQMHNDLDAVEHDQRLVTDHAFEAGTADHRRAIANLHTRLAFRWLLRGHAGKAIRHSRVVMAHEASRLVTLPVTAATRRIACRGLGHWPPAHPEGVLAAGALSSVP